MFMLFSHREIFVQCLNELIQSLHENNIDYYFDSDYDDYCNPDTFRLHDSNSCRDCWALGDCGVIYDFYYKIKFYYMNYNI
jgi:hypothetical protein